jgi:dephospho-CoA kinase
MTCRAFTRLILCLAGPLAAGKNAVADILAARGFACGDADVLAHRVIAEKRDEIVRLFRRDAEQAGISLVSGGELDRQALGSLLFKNPALLARQEALVHPETERLIAEFIDAHPDRHVAINAAVLCKTALMARCPLVLYVDAPRIVRFFRVRRRNQLPARRILERFRAQRHIRSQYKRANADIYTIWNNGSFARLEQKVDDFLRYCEKRGYVIWKKESEHYGL